MDVYSVKRTEKKIVGRVTVPGSKSVTNRALFLAAMSEGKACLRGALFSDDSRHFIGSLISLGYEVKVDEDGKCIELTGCGNRLPKKTGTIDVGSAGTAARFLTAMLALSDGEYTINASRQMQARPMKPLFDALEELGASFSYINEEGFLPVKVKGRLHGTTEATKSEPKQVHIDISKSTQFLSALLMAAVMIPEGLDIHITSEKTDGSYIRITREMMKQFGCEAVYDGHDYHVFAGQKYIVNEYYIEPDISAACYFWAMAAISGGSVTVNKSHSDMMQGDMKFLYVLENMGCKWKDDEQGITVMGPEDGLRGVDEDMNDFSDQTMTLAAIAPFARSKTIIRGIGHIRLQESDRLEAIMENLSAMGIQCRSFFEDGKECLEIIPGKIKPCNIKTYDDHRMAMAFTVTGLGTDGIVIEDPMCCRKTFENYYEVLEGLIK